MGAERPVARELEHLRSERREHARGPRALGRRRVESVQVLAHRRQRASVAARLLGVDDRRMADPEPEQEASREVPLEPLLPLGHVDGLVHPDVEDPGRDLRPRRRPEQALHALEDRAADVRNPERSEAELVQFRGGVHRLGRVAEPKLRAPDPDGAQLREACHPAA